MEAFLVVVMAAIITWFIVKRRRKEIAKKEGNLLTDNKSNFFNVPVKSNFSLSARQIDKINSIYNTFSDVYPISQEDIIVVFTVAPDSELEIDFWLKMRDSYLEILKQKNILEIPAKKEVFQLLLNCSKIPLEELLKKIKTEHLNQNDIEYIIDNFTNRLNKKWSL
jgi:hypothetical protein